MAIVDFQQKWTIHKRFERWFKVAFKGADPDGLSAIAPDRYFARFMDKIEDLLYLDEVEYNNLIGDGDGDVEEGIEMKTTCGDRDGDGGGGGASTEADDDDDDDDDSRPYGSMNQGRTTGSGNGWKSSEVDSHFSAPSSSSLSLNSATSSLSAAAAGAGAGGAGDATPPTTRNRRSSVTPKRRTSVLSPHTPRGTVGVGISSAATTATATATVSEATEGGGAGAVISDPIPEDTA
jgi:hypothetical protein